MEIGTGAKFVLLMSQLLTVGCAIIVTFHPNILYAAVALLFSFLGVAVLFVFAGADFLAGAQMVIYIGGVTILVLFAIMLTHWIYNVKLRDLTLKILFASTIAGACIVPFLYKAIVELSSSVKASPPANMEVFASLPKTEAVGKALLGTYLLPFEGITVLLLGALVGAVWLARPAK